jgi:trans-aconitate methyltransferase
MDPRSDPDPWLVRWLPLLSERSQGLPVLELGCGSGPDSRVLHAAGLSVIGVDSSPSQIEAARAALPGVEFHTLDIREPFPVKSAIGVVLASLVLHYFSWSETIGIALRLHRTLRVGGVLLVRVNSTHDHEYGATPWRSWASRCSPSPGL